MGELAEMWRPVHRRGPRPPCPVDGCEGKRMPDRPLCESHWLLVARSLRDEIDRAFRRWQTNRGPIDDYRDAARRAVDAARQEVLFP